MSLKYPAIYRLSPDSLTTIRNFPRK